MQGTTILVPVIATNQDAPTYYNDCPCRRRDILGKIERTKLLRRHLKKLDKSVEQPALRQYWLKVKDMERELAVAHNQDDATESDLESQVNHVLK